MQRIKEKRGKNYKFFLGVRENFTGEVLFEEELTSMRKLARKKRGKGMPKQPWGSKWRKERAREQKH